LSAVAYVVPSFRRLWLYAVVALVLVFLVAPILIVIPMSFSPTETLIFPPSSLSLRWYGYFFSSPEWMDAAWVSIRAASLTVILATPLGVTGAYSLHVSRGQISRLIVPLIIPVILIAIGVFFLYSRLSLNNTIAGLVFAHTLLAIPFVLVTVLAALRRYDMTQEMVARTLGASRLRAFLQITAPQISASIIAGSFFAFVTSFDEVVVALFVSRGPASTLTRKMFTSLRDQVSPVIASISTMLIALSILAAIVMTTREIRRSGARGR
jgi:putative spermidine/putrescine transport system permease protein